MAAGGKLRAAGPELLADYGGRVIEHGEYALKSRHLQDLPDRRARTGKLKVAAPFAGQPLGGEQHIHAGGVAEFNPGHVHDDPGGTPGGHRGGQLGMQPWRCVEVDLARYRHNGVIALILARDL